MFLGNERGIGFEGLDKQMFDRVESRKREVFDLIDVMFERGDVTDEYAENMGIELYDELVHYGEFLFGVDSGGLLYWGSRFEQAQEDVLTYVRESRRVLVGGIRSVRRLDSLEARNVYVVLLRGRSFSDLIFHRETELSEREFLLALPELRTLVNFVDGRSGEVDLDEFSRVRLPVDEELYVVESIEDVQIYYVDRYGSMNRVELV